MINMFRLISILWFFVIGCSESQMNPMAFEDCDCGLEISSTLPYNETDESYELEYNSELSRRAGGRRKEGIRGGREPFPQT